MDTSIAPKKVSVESIDALMATVSVQFHVFPGTTTTAAAVFLPDGFCLACEISACVDPKIFDAEIGRKLAEEKAMHAAREKLWEMEGYMLRAIGP